MTRAPARAATALPPREWAACHDPRLLHCVRSALPTMSIRLHSIYQRRVLVAVLLLALAFTQTLGAVHRVLSGHATSHRNAATATGTDGGFVESLFAGHHDDRDCKVFDQQAHADLASGEVAASQTLAAVETLVTTHAAWQIASQAAGYLARAPPVRA